MPKPLKMVQVDVFTSTALEGNSLAVFLDGSGLSTDQMQSLAREMNLSETTFILPSSSSGNGSRVRIFTVQEELPFAGHPTLGTAFVLRGNTGKAKITLELNVGKVPVSFEDELGKPCFGEMTQLDPKFGETHDPGVVADACGLPTDAIESSLPIQTISTGVGFTVVPIRSLATLQALHIDFARADKYLSQRDAKFFYFVSRETIDPNARLQARMFFYNGEDPATGSAAGCAAAWMVAHSVARPDERVLIEQGIEMKRRSRIFVRASKQANRVVNVRVGGNVVEIMRAEVFL
ncbi:MAG TPA: PhzF family phenazine biosynthesis protein [Terriglobales bacterium]